MSGALCIALATMWVAGQWEVSFGSVLAPSSGLTFDYLDKQYSVSFGPRLIEVKWCESYRGQIRHIDLAYLNPSSGRGDFVFVRAPETGRWGSRTVRYSRHGVLAFPYWFAIVLTAALPAARFLRWWRSQRRVAKSRCPTCGYDLRATPHCCPECGAAQPPHNPPISGPPRRQAAQ